jgi:hypothetical protein
MLVKRASDLAELTVGFVGDYIDSVAVSTFGAGTEVRCKTWYNQSQVAGVQNGVQNTWASMPVIYASGAFNDDGLYFNSKELLVSNDGFGIAYQLSWYLNIKCDDYTFNSRAFIKLHASGYTISTAFRATGYIWNVAQNATYYYDIDNRIGNEIDASKMSICAVYDGVSMTQYKNSALIFSVAAGGGGNIVNDTGIVYIGSGNASEFLIGNIKTLIVTTSVLNQSQVALLGGV